MELTRTAYGTWSGGRFMHFGEALPEERYLSVIRHAYDSGIRTFMTADAYGQGEADRLLGQALKGLPRESYSLVGAVGHDFYKGTRSGSKGFPRFTDPSLRSRGQFRGYLEMATEKSLERCGVDVFDLLLLHNPDEIGYEDEAVWKGMETLKESGLARQLGVAPGPANGFTLDVIGCFERFGGLMDWAMLILNPLEPWPGQLALPAAQEHGVNVITRVVDYGGLFHDDVKPGHPFGERDHRMFRPPGWVEAGVEKIDQMRPIAETYGVTMLQLACLWNLSHDPVKSVIPTMIQEPGPEAKPIEAKVTELAELPESVRLSDEDRAALAAIGDNKGCMALKGGNPEHEAAAYLPDRWQLTPELISIAKRWGIDPDADLAHTHARTA